MLRSILAIVLGYLTIIATTIVVTIALCIAFGVPLNASGAAPKPSTAFSVANLIASALCALLGGLVAASIARRSRQLHAFVLAMIVLVLGLVFALFEKNGPEPLWYLMILPILGALAVIAGGMLRRGATAGN